MIIAITSSASVELRDANNFRDFKILVEKTDADRAFVARALEGIATVEADGKLAWVSQDALRKWQGRDQPAEWVASFNKMVESVKRFGWVDEAHGTVRGHIEIV